MKTKIFILLISLMLVSCNTEASAKRKIANTVTNFLNAVEKNDVNEYKSLIYESEKYPGVISMERKFFNRNYKKINSYINLKENIKIKDTVFNGAKRKYVQYNIMNSNPNYLQKPLIITFIFYKQAGYDQIYNPSVLDNFLNWE